MVYVKVRPGDSVEKMLRALKKKVDKEGVMKELKKHRRYLKPSEFQKAKSKAADKHRSKR